MEHVFTHFLCVGAKVKSKGIKPSSKEQRNKKERNCRK